MAQSDETVMPAIAAATHLRGKPSRVSSKCSPGCRLSALDDGAGSSRSAFSEGSGFGDGALGCCLRRVGLVARGAAVELEGH